MYSLYSLENMWLTTQDCIWFNDKHTSSWDITTVLAEFDDWFADDEIPENVDMVSKHLIQIDMILNELQKDWK
jgi:hypothetical protein